MLKEKQEEEIEYVVKNSEHVKINQKEVEAYSSKLDIKEYKDELVLYKDKYSEEKRILLAFLLETLNCQDEGKSRKEFLEQTKKKKELLDINALKNMDFSTLEEIVKTEEKYNNFMEVVRYVSTHPFYEDLYRIKDIETLYQYIVTNLKSFLDTALYKHKRIRFYRRATRVIYNLFLLSNTIRENIIDKENSLYFVDPILQDKFQKLGLLSYDVSLTRMLEEKRRIASGSDFEVEIRANTLYVLIKIKENLEKRNIEINTIALNALLKEDIEAHKNYICNTINY